MSETQELANWACQLRWENVPDHTRSKTKQCLLEFLSCCLVARNEEPAKLLISVLEQLGTAPQASIIGHPMKLSVEHAALVNGALGHIWEIDDTHRQTMSHPGDSVIPAVLAAAEWIGSDGPSILTAITAGYEVAIRVCDAVSPSHLEKGWHPTGTTNTFGTAVAVGRLLKLNTKEMAWALGLAATQAAGTFCHIPERAMSKDLNPGKAAANGMLAALLARQGFTGSPTAIENKKGFVYTHADEAHLDRITQGLGLSYKIDEIAFKPYSSCRHSHAAIEAMLQLIKTYGLTLHKIKSVQVGLYPMAAFFVNDPVPFNKGLFGPRYSVQFNLALALVSGEGGIQKALFDKEYVLAMLMDSQIRQAMEKVEVNIDMELASDWPNKWPSWVKVLMLDGQSYYKLIEYPLGEPEHPMPYSQLVSKFRGASQSYLTELECGKVVETIENLEQLDNITILMELCSKKGLRGGER